MTKTIEEAAKSIAKDFIIEHKSRINNDAPLTHECVQYAIERIFAMPLSERLTAEEKERVKALHYHLNGVLAYCHPSADKIVEATMHDLESIFGKDFFKEGE